MAKRDPPGPLMFLGLCRQKSADKWPIHAGACYMDMLLNITNGTALV